MAMMNNNCGTIPAPQSITTLFCAVGNLREAVYQIESDLHCVEPYEESKCSEGEPTTQLVIHATEEIMRLARDLNTAHKALCELRARIV